MDHYSHSSSGTSLQTLVALVTRPRATCDDGAVIGYDVRRFEDASTGWVWACVGWTPAGTDIARRVVGGYLLAHNGRAVTCCGVAEACADLGLPLPNSARLVMLCEVIDVQLVDAPRAVLSCPDGVLSVELVSPR